jgi:hypothetical protein
MDSDSAIASQKLQTDLLELQDWFKKWRMRANESKSINVTCTTRREKCPPPPGPYKQCATPPRKGCQVSWATPWQETYLAQTHFHETETGNHPHQNVLVTRTKVKTLYKQQTSHPKINTQTNMDLRNTTMGYGFHFQHRHSRTFPIESLAHDSGRTLVVPNTVIRRDIQIPTVKEEIHRYSSQYNARLSAHPNDLIVNLMELPDNRRLRRHLPNDLPTRFLV